MEYSVQYTKKGQLVEGSSTFKVRGDRPVDDQLVIKCAAAMVGPFGKIVRIIKLDDLPNGGKSLEVEEIVA